MKIKILVVAVAFGVVASLARCAEPPAPPAELKVLQPLVGTWKVAEFVSKKAEWTPEEIRTSGDVATTKWVMGGWFLEDRKVPANGTDHLGIWHYDASERVYHYTMFQSPGGNRTDLTIRWDERAKSFTGTASLPNGVTMRTTTRLIDPDTKAWTAIATDAAGKVYLDMAAKEVRVQAK